MEEEEPAAAGRRWRESVVGAADQVLALHREEEPLEVEQTLLLEEPSGASQFEGSLWSWCWRRTLGAGTGRSRSRIGASGEELEQVVHQERKLEEQPEAASGAVSGVSASGVALQLQWLLLQLERHQQLHRRFRCYGKWWLERVATVPVAPPRPSPLSRIRQLEEEHQLWWLLCRWFISGRVVALQEHQLLL